MNGEKKRRVRYRPVGAHRKNTDASMPAYGPVDTGCPAVELAIDRLYEAGDAEREARFWALMKGVNYALQMETEVLVPLKTAPSGQDIRTNWARCPIPAERVDDLPAWTLTSPKGLRFMPVFTRSEEVGGNPMTAHRPVTVLALRRAMERAVADGGLAGLVLNPWGRSATLDKSILEGLLGQADAQDDEPGAEYAREGRAAACEGRWQQAAALYRASHEKGCAEGTRLLAGCCDRGRGVRKNRSQALRLWKEAAALGDVPAQIALGDRCAADPGKALMAYRKARAMAEYAPDISSWPLLCLRLAQHELQYIDLRGSRLLLAEAIHGLGLLAERGDPDADALRDEALALAAAHTPADGLGGQGPGTEALHLD